MKNILAVLWREEEGQDLVEHAMLMALIALAVMTTMTSLGISFNTVFSAAADKIKGS